MSAQSGPTIVCDVAALPAADLAAVGSLARIALEARRQGLRLRLAGVDRTLADLIVLTGLGEVLGVESGGQPEEREQALGVEEERQLDDRSA